MALDQMSFDFPTQVVNVSTVPQRSPFRYPGGKTWLVPQLRRWLRSLGRTPGLFVEPFAGGAIAGLTAAFEGLAQRVLLVELDAQVAGVWRVILEGDGQRLAERILSFEFTMDQVKAALGAGGDDPVDRAFATLLRNRVQHGGILAPGASMMKGGENGRGLSSRWYPRTLAQRIIDLQAVRNRIEFRQGDALEVIREHAAREDALFFVDPPYTVAARRLYCHGQIDHAALFAEMSRVRGDFLMTYDDTAEVRAWAAHHGFDVATAAMKSRQHVRKMELLIGRNMAWARG